MSNKMQSRAIIWRYREKQRTNSAKIVGEPGEIRTWLLPNTSQKHYPSWFKFLGTCLGEWLGCDVL